MGQTVDRSFLVPPTKTAETAKTQQISNTAIVQNHKITQEATRLAMMKLEKGEDTEMFNAIFMLRRQGPRLDHLLRRLARTFSSKTSKDELEEEVIVEAIQEIERAAEEFYNKNPMEVEKDQLRDLRKSINDDDSPNEILRKVLKYYPDYALADMAFDFLLDITHGKLRENVEIAKKIFYQNFEHEIAAYKNTLVLSQVFAKEGLGVPSNLRALYRDISTNPHDPHLLFDKLSKNFTYDHLRKVIRYLLHSLGADLTSKGPSIDRGELYKLFSDVRTLQAILGVYLFFRSRMKLLRTLFTKNQMDLPKGLNFENIAKSFMELLKDKAVSPEKVSTQIDNLNVRELVGRIFVTTQMRDGIRNVAPRLYKTEKQKQEILQAIITLIEDMDDILLEAEEEENAASGSKEP